MIQRIYCQHCQYPLKTCVCSAVSPLNNQSAIDILQHPSEQKAAKNTARLVALCAAHTHLWVGETPASFTVLKQQLADEQRPIVVVYPNPHSKPLHPVFAHSQSCVAHSYRFVFLDGTWKKAYKLWQLNPWLHTYPSVHLEDVKGQYAIRKAPSEHCLSTLEAVAYCLKSAEHINVEPLYNCLHKMQASFLQHRP